MAVSLMDVWNFETFDGNLLAELKANETLVRKYIVTDREIFLEREAAAASFRAGEGRAPKGHDSVADILVDDAVIAAHRLGHHGYVPVQHIDQCRRRHALAEGGEPLHVAKQDRHLATRAFGLGQLRPVQQPRDDARIDIFAEGVADPRLDPQLAWREGCVAGDRAQASGSQGSIDALEELQEDQADGISLGQQMAAARAGQL